LALNHVDWKNHDPVASQARKFTFAAASILATTGEKNPADRRIGISNKVLLRPAHVCATGMLALSTGVLMNRNDQQVSRIAEIGADDAEVLALSVLRFVAAGYMTSDVARWDAAYDAAERVLGPVEGPQLVAAMTGIMRAIRCERGGDWVFMPATCCRATADEYQLIGLINCARRGLLADLREKAESLMRGQSASSLCASVTAAADKLNILRFVLALRTPRPVNAAIH
jgi:hypothetical protein